MILSRILFIVTSFTLYLSASAQVAIGHYTDVEGLPTEGYLDPISYSPKEQVIINYRHMGFEKGAYYDQNGKRNEGLIKIVDHDKIYFKENKNDKDKKIKAEDLRIVTVGIDSFFTIPSVTTGSGILKSTSTQLVHYVTTVGSTIYSRYYNLAIGGFTYYYKKTYGSSWNEVPARKKDFQEFVSKSFYHIPYLEEKISTNELSAGDMMTIIKTAEYELKMENNKPIYLSRYWEEVKKSQEAFYKMKVISRDDSVYTVQYLKNNELIYEGQYSSFFPHRKNGVFKAYTDGTLRKKSQFLNNILKRVQTYHSNDSLHHDYSTVVSGSTGYEKRIFSFNDVKNRNGDSIIEGMQFEEQVSDEVNDRTIHYEFKNNQLLSYYFDENEKIYQLNSMDYNTRINRFQKRINDYLDNRTFEEALVDNVNGTVMVAIIVDSERNVEYKVLNELHPEVDKAIEDFFKSAYFTTLKLPKFKMRKEKASVEFVLPITFMINRFYRNPPNYHFNHFNHHMMMQMHQIPAVSPPSFPRY